MGDCPLSPRPGKGGKNPESFEKCELQ